MAWNLPNYEPNTTLSPCSAGYWSQCLVHTIVQTLQHCFISSNLDCACVCACACVHTRMRKWEKEREGEREKGEEGEKERGREKDFLCSMWWPLSLCTFSLYKLITLETCHSNEKLTNAPSGKFNLRSRSCKQQSMAMNMINTKLL